MGYSSNSKYCPYLRMLNNRESTFANLAWTPFANHSLALEILYAVAKNNQNWYNFFLYSRRVCCNTWKNSVKLYFKTLHSFYLKKKMRIICCTWNISDIIQRFYITSYLSKLWLQSGMTNIIYDNKICTTFSWKLKRLDWFTSGLPP